MGLQNEVLVNASGMLSDAELPTTELFKGYPDGLLKFATISSLIIMLIGIPGNIFTIVALARYKKVRNATAIFIMNLSCSDLIFCFHIPLAASVFHHRAWIHGQTLYQITLFTRYTLFVNSLFTVFAITINRYIMIAHPMSYSKIYKKRNIIIMLVCSWIITITLIIPIVFKINGRSGVNNGSYSSLSQDPSRRSLKNIIFLIAFFLPVIAIIFCYGRIFCIVRKATKGNKSCEKSLNTRERLSNPKTSSSAALSISVSERVTGETSYNSICTEQFKSTKISVRNTNITDRFTEIKMSDNFIRQTENIDKESPKLNQTMLRKSMKVLKMALPTRKDRRLGTIIIAIMTSFCLCHLPLIIIKVFLEKNVQPTLSIAAHILFFSSFSVNPITYVVISNEYRKAYKNLFKRRKTLLPLRKSKIAI